MTNLFSKLLKSSGLMLFCMLATQGLFAQNGANTLTPGGYLDTIIDGYGNRYALGEMIINDTLRAAFKGDPAPQSLIIPNCNSGYFQLYLEPGCGLDGNAPDDQARLAIVCRVLYDISQFIVSPLSSSPINQKVNIWVRRFDQLVDVNQNPNTVGVASSFYSAPPSATLSGIADNMVSQTIRSGIDAYTNVSLPLNTVLGTSSLGTTYFHGLIGFKSGTFWHLDLTTLPGAGHSDFYTVVLHEMLHALGFASLIDIDGSSKLGYGYSYYSRYDLNLRSGVSNLPLLTNSSNCSVYNFGWNVALSPFGTLYFVPPTCLLNDHTECTTAVKYHGGLSIPQHVFTPDCWTQGSSLSHFEDECQVPATFPLTPPASNNQYFVMSNATGSQVHKRYPKPEERQVLCDIGYTVNTVYGDPVAVAQSYFNYPGTTCPGNSVVGINDGLNNGLFSYVTAAGTGVQISGNASGLLVNDVIPAAFKGFECLEDITPGGAGFFSATTGTSATTVFYTPPAGSNGTRLLRYIPYNTSTQQRGNITYVYVYVLGPNCPTSICNLVNNFDFESSVGCNDISNGFGQIDCFSAAHRTPDLFNRNGCSFQGYMIPTSQSNPPSDSYNGSPNDHFAGLWLWGNGTNQYEAVFTKLNAPLQPGTTYTLSFWAKVSNNWANCEYKNFPIQFRASTNPVAPWPYSTLPPNATSVLANFTVPAPPSDPASWHYITQTITYPSNSPQAGFLYVMSAPYLLSTPTGQVYAYIDDIRINPAVNVSTFTPPSTINACSGITPLNLANYVSIPGGTFSGPGVTGNIFDPADAVAVLNTTNTTELITLGYTYSSSCGQQTVFAQIQLTNILPPGQCCMAPIPPAVVVCNNCDVAQLMAQFQQPPNPTLTTTSTILFDGVFSVNQNFEFNGCPNLLFGPNSSIEVAPGVTFKINTSTLKAACNRMWKGISTLSASSKVEVLKGTLMDMIDGVHTTQGSEIKATGSTFTNNYVSVSIENAPFNYTGSFMDNTFNTIGSLRHPYLGSKAKIGIRTHNCRTVNVGTNASSGGNRFNNLNTGIYIGLATGMITNNILFHYNILNNSFTNITGGDYGNTSLSDPVNSIYADPDGTAIFAVNAGYPVNSTVTVDYPLNPTNQFNNCTKAVTVTGMHARVTGAKLANVTWGLNFSKTSPFTYTIMNNSLTNAYYGISFADNTYNASVIGNSISSSSQTNQWFNQVELSHPVGILVNYFSGGSGNNFKVANNGIVMNASGGIGIQVINSGITIDENFITLPNPNAPSSPRELPLVGIWTSNARGCHISCNQVTGNTGLLSQTRRNLAGIYLSDSRDVVLDCNTVTAQRFGFLVLGNCGPSDPRTNAKVMGNNFSNHINGWMLRNLANPGSLGASIGTTSFDNNNRFNGNVYAVQNGNLMKVFKVDNCQFATNEKISTSNGTISNTESGGLNGNCKYAVQGNQIPFTTYSCPMDCYQMGEGDLEYVTDLQLAERIARDSVLYSEFQEGASWLAAQRLFYDLHKDTATLNGSQVLDSFYMSVQNSVLGHIRATDELISSVNEAFVSDQQAYEQWLAQAEQANGEIAGVDQQEINENTINGLYLKWQRFGIDSLSSDDSAAIGDLALQCPWIGGSAVYKARMMYALFVNETYDDIDICNNAGVYKGGNGIFDEQNAAIAMLHLPSTYEKQIAVYPNPTTGKITVQYLMNGDEVVHFEVLDLQGRLIKEVRLSPMMGAQTIDLGSPAAGTYYYRLVVNGIQKATGKLILVK